MNVDNVSGDFTWHAIIKLVNFDIAAGTNFRNSDDPVLQFSIVIEFVAF